MIYIVHCLGKVYNLKNFIDILHLYSHLAYYTCVHNAYKKYLKVDEMPLIPSFKNWREFIEKFPKVKPIKDKDAPAYEELSQFTPTGR